MQSKFDIVKISASLAERTLQLLMSREVDEKSISSDVINLAERVSRRVLPCAFTVTGSLVSMELLEWPVPNIEYVLLVQKGVLSAMGEELPTSMQRNITFASEITSKITITSPTMFEQMNVCSLAWQEDGDVLCNKYYVEVATDQGFFNLERDDVVLDDTTLILGGLANNQYYVRVRAQDDSVYGTWSPVVTFLIKSQYDSPGVSDPVYVRQLKVLTQTPDNATPSTFDFVFNTPINTGVMPVAQVSKLIGFARVVVNCTVTVTNATISLTPTDGPFEDNCRYEVSLFGVEAAGYEGDDPFVFVKTTTLTPMYASMDDVMSLMGGWSLPVNRILYYVHEASLYADYLRTSAAVVKSTVLTLTVIPFEVTQFVRYRAAKEALLSLFMDKAAETGEKGQVGEVSYAVEGDLPSLKDLMGMLDLELKTWEEAVRGYGPEGRNKPISAIRGQRLSTNVRYDSFGGTMDRSNF